MLPLILSNFSYLTAREYSDSDDEESAYDDAIFQEVVPGLLVQGDTRRRRELPAIKTETEGVNL